MNPDANGTHPQSADALVVFGATGDLAHKKIFPALYAMCRHDALSVPVIGVASSKWRDEQLQTRARESVEQVDGEIDSPALERLLAALHYVSGDYKDAVTFDALRLALSGARRPAFYLAIPPALFATVIRGLAAAGLADGARVIVEKPFGRDLASARELNQVALDAFPEDAAAKPVRRRGGARGRQLPALSPVATIDHRAGCAGKTRRQGIHRRPTRVLAARGGAQRAVALRTSADRRDAR